MNKNKTVFQTTRIFEIATIFLRNKNFSSLAINSHYNSVEKITLRIKLFIYLSNVYLFTTTKIPTQMGSFNGAFSYFH